MIIKLKAEYIFYLKSALLKEQEVQIVAAIMKKF